MEIQEDLEGRNRLDLSGAWASHTPKKRAVVQNARYEARVNAPWASSFVKLPIHWTIQLCHFIISKQTLIFQYKLLYYACVTCAVTSPESRSKLVGTGLIPESSSSAQVSSQLLPSTPIWVLLKACLRPGGPLHIPRSSLEFWSAVFYSACSDLCSKMEEGEYWFLCNVNFRKNVMCTCMVL